MHRSTSLFAAATVLLAFAAGSASASVFQVDQSAFQPSAGMITFSEYPLNTVNPVYTPNVYGGGAGSPTVTFGGYFVGQMPGITNPAACPAGAAITGCVLGNPSGPLTIDPASSMTFLSLDGAQPTAPVLSGSPQFNGSIAVAFSTPQSGVGLIGGYFNAVGSTAITAYAAYGTEIGQVTNTEFGDEFLGLVTADGSATISGLEFSLVGAEPAGFDIDNLQFGAAAQVSPMAVTPEPSSMMLLGTGLLTLPALARRRMRRPA